MIPENINIDTHIPIFIFWHIYIDENRLERGVSIIQRQYNKIKESGLLDRCEAIHIGYVSSITFPCENIINDPKVKIIIHKTSGYEGVTTNVLKAFCLQKVR